MRTPSREQQEVTQLLGDWSGGDKGALEKLIPLVIANALAGKPLPIYGDGLNVRDWLYVKDHCSAIRTVLADGRVGETYNVGGENEKTNIDIVRGICRLLDEFRPDPAGPRERLIDAIRQNPKKYLTIHLKIF